MSGYRRTRRLSSDGIPLSPMVAEDEESDHAVETEGHSYSPPHHGHALQDPQHSPSQGVSQFQRPSTRTCLSNDRHVIFLILTVMSLVFIVLNVVQIALIFRISNYYWTVLFPGILFVGFVAYFAYESYRRRAGLAESWNQADCIDSPECLLLNMEEKLTMA